MSALCNAMPTPSPLSLFLSLSLLVVKDAVSTLSLGRKGPSFLLSRSHFLSRGKMFKVAGAAVLPDLPSLTGR